jgi:uncharacterized protein DUF4232
MLTRDRVTSGSSATPPRDAAPSAPRAGRQSWLAATITLLAAAAITTTILIVRGDRAGAPATAPNPTAIPEPTSTPTATGRPAACPVTQLEISVSDTGRGEGGMGHSSSALVFRNIGAATCVLRGYPGVTGLDARGRGVAPARQTLRGYLGGLDPAATTPPTVTLAPGRSASALVEALNAAPDGTACTPFPALRVGVPGGQASVTVPWGNASGCAHLQVHPFVPSSDGHMDPVAPDRGGWHGA